MVKLQPNIRQQLTKWIPTRAVMCLMMFTACWTSYVIRMQFPILMVKMIYVKSADNEPPSGSRGLFDWNSGLAYDYGSAAKNIRGQLTAAYSYGNVPGNLLGSILSMRFGPRNLLIWSQLLAAVLSLFAPILCNAHWALLLFTRLIAGMAGGFVFPACHTLVAAWSPPGEKSRFVWSLMGGAFGTIFTYPMIGSIADSMGWEWGWYIPALMNLFWIISWTLLAYDSPSEHPGISEDEKAYILSSQAATSVVEKPTFKETPFLQICTSIPFISLVTCHFGNLFLLFFYQYQMTVFLTNAMKMSITKGGMLASLPWAARVLFGFFFSWGGDAIKKKEIISLTLFRKCAMIFSHTIPGLFFIGVAYFNSNPVLVHTFLILALGFNGAASISNLSNNQDLSPNHAGFLYGIMNTIGCISGMLVSPMTELIVTQDANLNEWRIVFWIVAGVCNISMIVFLIGGSAEVQSWNAKS